MGLKGAANWETKAILRKRTNGYPYYLQTLEIAFDTLKPSSGRKTDSQDRRANWCEPWTRSTRPRENAKHRPNSDLRASKRRGQNSRASPEPRVCRTPQSAIRRRAPPRGSA